MSTEDRGSHWYRSYAAPSSSSPKSAAAAAIPVTGRRRRRADGKREPAGQVRIAQQIVVKVLAVAAEDAVELIQLGFAH